MRIVFFVNREIFFAKEYARFFQSAKERHEVYFVSNEPLLGVDEGALVMFSKPFEAKCLLKKESIYPYYQAIKRLHPDLLHTFLKQDVGLLAYYASEHLSVPLLFSAPKEKSSAINVTKHLKPEYARRLNYHIDKLYSHVRITEADPKEDSVWEVMETVWKKSREDYLVKDVNFRDDSVLVTLENPTGEIDLLLPLDAYADYHLRIGNPVERLVISDLLKEERLFEAYRKALEKLKYQDRSEKELHDYLRRYCHLEEEETQELLSRLKRKGYVNDERYALEATESLKAQQIGPSAVKARLQKKGIRQEILNDVLQQFDNEETLEMAKEYASKAEKQIRNKSLKQKKSILKTKLLQRGYNSEVSEQVLSELDLSQDATEEDEILKKAFEKAYRRYERKYSGNKLRDNLFRYLLTQGFSYESISLLWNKYEELDYD